MLTPTYRQSANNIGRRYIGGAVAEFGKVCSHAVLHSLCKLRGTRVKQLDLFFSKTLSKTELKKSSNCSHNLEYWVYVNTLIAIFSFLESIKGILYHYTKHTSILGDWRQRWVAKTSLVAEMYNRKIAKKQCKPWGRCYLVRLFTGFKHEWLKNRKKSSW